MRVSAPGTLVGDPWGFFRKRTSGPMLAVAAVSKWASVGIAKVDVAADVDVAAEARSAVVRKAGTRGHLGFCDFVSV